MPAQYQTQEWHLRGPTGHQEHKRHQGENLQNKGNRYGIMESVTAKYLNGQCLNNYINKYESQSTGLKPIVN